MQGNDTRKKIVPGTSTIDEAVHGYMSKIEKENKENSRDSRQTKKKKLPCWEHDARKRGQEN